MLNDPFETTSVAADNTETVKELEKVWQDAADETLYDLHGRRVNGTPRHGIYLRQGRKVII